MSGYNLMTLNAGTIIDNFTVEQLPKNNNHRAKFEYDLSDKSSIRRELISSIDRYDDNALFYQIRQVVGDTAATEENALQQVILFIDFEEVFKTQKDFKTKEYTSLKKEDFNANPVYRLKWIFDKDNGGITLTFDGKNFKTFVPFDKSASMSRDCKISFIDKDIKEKVDNRLLLDLDFSKIKVVASKYYAYRGLYLSSGYRIEQAGIFQLNAETVIVLNDIEELWSGNVFTAKLNDNFWECQNSDEELSVNLFDGEGLISPDFAIFISPSLHFRQNCVRFVVRFHFWSGVKFTPAR